ncbi:hypothetical protein L917_08271, partial [Phytophthora nicotianae]
KTVVRKHFFSDNYTMLSCHFAWDLPHSEMHKHVVEDNVV